MKKIILAVTLVFIITAQIFSQQNVEQKLKTYQNPEEMVTLSPTIPFNQAIDLISKVSEKSTGRTIVSTVSIDSAIGITINNMNYMQALNIIVKMAGLYYEQKPDVIIIKRSQVLEKKRTADNYAPVDAREVRISAVFFESDVNKSKQAGIDWQTIFSKDGFQFGFKNGESTAQATGGTSTGGTSTGGTGTSTTNANATSPEFKVGATGSFNLGSYFGKATAIFKLLENENLGEIIASPNITVLDGTEARLQDGQDLAIKQRDFSGNIIENFYSIGSIVTVTPHVLDEEGIKYILLNIHVERSSFVPDPNNTIINKTSANTKVVMLNGEETIIGGMFINQTTNVRTGVPILKDLPWWVFGLRYVFGSEDKQVIKKELVILIKAELVPTLKERLAGPQTTSPLKDELEKQRKQIKYYQFNQSQSKDN